MTSPNGPNGPTGLDSLMQDPDEAEARIDAWARGLTEKAERYQAAHQRTEAIRLTSASSDGSIQVTVRADGSVTDLRLNERVRTLSLEQLSDQILTTMRQAQSGIADRVDTVLAEEVGDGDEQTRAAMVGQLRQRFPVTDAYEEPELDEPAWNEDEDEEPDR